MFMGFRTEQADKKKPRQIEWLLTFSHLYKFRDGED